MTSLLIILLCIVLSVLYCTSVELEQRCMQYAENVHSYHPTENLDDLLVYGKWMSSSCEIVASHFINHRNNNNNNNKPKFIVRRLDLSPSSTWNGYFYHYTDSWCTQPKFIVKVIGTYEILRSTATPNSQPTKASRFKFSKIFFHIKDKQVLESAINFIVSHCPNAIKGRANAPFDDKIDINVDELIGKDVPVNATELLLRKKCRYYFGLHPYSYSKVRLVRDRRRKAYLKNQHIEQDTLYFADIPPKHKANPFEPYPYNQYQYGLSRLNNPSCLVCQKVNKRDQVNIEPIMPKPIGLQDFTGAWTSSVCESATGTQYQTRNYKIFPKQQGKSYGEIYKQLTVFKDSNCKEKSFSYMAGGVYKESKDYEVIKDATYIKLEYSSLTITPHEQSMLDIILLEDDGLCGKSSLWKIGESQNVTITGGCSTAQIRLPVITAAVLRVFKDTKQSSLYINEEDDNRQLRYFTQSLTSCKSLTKDIKVDLNPTTTPSSYTSIIKTNELYPSSNTGDTNEQGGKKPPGNTSTKNSCTIWTILTVLSAACFLSRTE